MDPLQSFGKTAKELSRNPLGIIALFIVLVYGIAALTLDRGASGLEPDQKTMIVWFLVVFPPIVLGVFAWLVSQHHTKLYAPGDFRDDRAFLQALSPAEQRQRLEKEVIAALEVEVAPEANEEQPQSVSPPSVEDKRQVVQSVALAEDLALREVAAEFGGILQRQLKIQRGGLQLWLDGVIEKNGELIGVEVQFLRGRSGRDRLRGLADELLRSKMAGMKMVVAIVFEDVPPAEVERRVRELQQRLDAGNIAAELRVYQLSELQKKYGLSAGT